MPHNAMIMTSKERRSLESKLSRLAPTPKQMDLIERIITHYGMKRVAMYFFDRFPTGSFANLSRLQAQKIIGALASQLFPGDTSGIGPWTLPEQYWRDE